MLIVFSAPSSPASRLIIPGRQGVPQHPFCEMKMGPDKPVKPMYPNINEFIEFIAPMAIELQRETGLPASYLIAQAGMESGWGRSNGYRIRNSLFGYSCSRGRGALQKLTFITRMGREISVDAHCTSPRPEGGHYYSFDSMMDGFWAQAYLLMYSVEGARLTALRQLMSQTVAPQTAKPYDVIMRIRGYAASMSSERYQAYLLGTIRQFGLETYDSLCL